MLDRSSGHQQVQERKIAKRRAEALRKVEARGGTVEHPLLFLTALALDTPPLGLVLIEPARPFRHDRRCS